MRPIVLISRFLLVVAVAAACAMPSRVGVASGATPLVGTRALARAIDAVVLAPEFSNAHWGIVAVDGRGDTLYSRNAGKLFMPASNQKIITAAVALAQLGGDYRYVTPVVMRGSVSGGVLHGDLVLVGRGDPTISDHVFGDALVQLRPIADSLVARGVRRVRGKVVAEGNAFADPVLGFGWSWDDLEADFAAPTDELTINEGFTRLLVRAGATAGDSVRVESRPTRTWPRLRVSALTVAATSDSSRRPVITIRKDTLSGDVLIAGTIAAGTVDTISVTHRDPSEAFLAAVREVLGEKGITITGDAVPSAAGDTIARIVSPPLREILPPFMKPSQNQIGELLFKTIGLERGGAGTSAAARRVIERQVVEWGAQPNSIIVRDGSGVARYNYVTPEAILRVLDVMRRRPDFPAFLDALPVAGVDGTLERRMRQTPAHGTAKAKTGSLTQARSLSGYLRTMDGDTVTFSIMANNWSVPSAAINRAVDSVTVRLASYRRR